MTARYFLLRSAGDMSTAFRAISRIPFSPRNPLELVARPPLREKSGSQRALWHLMLAEFGAAIGMTPRETKELVKKEYFGAERVTLPGGRAYEIVRESSEDLDREGYSRLINFTAQFAAESGVVLSTDGERRRT